MSDCFNSAILEESCALVNACAAKVYMEMLPSLDENFNGDSVVSRKLCMNLNNLLEVHLGDSLKQW